MFKLNVSGCTSLGTLHCWHNSGYCMTAGLDGGTAISFPKSIPCTDKHFLNNAMLSNEWNVRAGQKGYQLDGNCYYHGPGKTPRRFDWEKKIYPTIDAFRTATGQEMNGIYADPEFESMTDVGTLTFPMNYSFRMRDLAWAKDSSIGNLKLKETSPCIDRGVPIRGFNEDFKGRAPDIGAFEIR
jgi:hypothetical protein